MKWLMLIAVVLLAVQFIACEDEEKIEQLENEKDSFNEDIGELEEDIASEVAPFDTAEEAFIAFAEATVNNHHDTYADMFNPELEGGPETWWTFYANKMSKHPGTWSWGEPYVIDSFGAEGDILEGVYLEAVGIQTRSDDTQVEWDLSGCFVRTDEGWYCYPKK